MGDILFLAHRIPYPPNRGDKIRSWNILRHLSSLGRVHLACFADDEADAAHLEGLRAALGSRLGEAHVEVRKAGRLTGAARALRQGKPVSLTLFDSLGLRSFVSRLLARQDISCVFAFSGQMAQFVPEGLDQHFVMDFVDVDSAKFASYAEEGRGPMRWVNRREAAKLAAFEKQTAARADVSLFVSEAEAELFRARAQLPSARVEALQNGVDLGFYDPRGAFPPLAPDERGAGPLIVFTGQMDYRPNVEAVTGFAREVMPLVRQARPDARFAIVGRNPTQTVRGLAADRILVTGAVEDVRSWLAAADLVVAPLRIARGIQNKVLEAMAMAKPVVASPAAFEGINAVPGRDLIVAETPDAQASAVVQLLSYSNRAAEIGLAARQRMQSAYSWDAKLAPLARIIGLDARKAA